MTRKEWVKSPKNEKRWSNYNKARKHFSLCKLGRSVVLHHLNPACANYEEWNVDELVPMFTWCHTALHNKIGNGFKIGMPGFNLGRKFSDEARKKMSESHTGKSWSKKRRETYEREGIIVSDETRVKLSAVLKGHQGHVWTEEEKNRRSLAYKSRGIIPPSRKGTTISEEHKSRISAAMKGNKYAKKKSIAVGEVV